MAPVHTWLRLTWTWLRILQTSPDLCRHHRLCWHGPPVPLPLPRSFCCWEKPRPCLLGPPAPMSHPQQTRLPSGPAPVTRVGRPGCPADTLSLQENQVKPFSQPREPSVPQSHHPRLKTCSLSLGRPRGGGVSVPSPCRSEGPLGLQHQQTETGRSRHAEAEDRVLALAGCVHFSPSGCRHDKREGLWPPWRGSALLAHLCSSEVMACLHRLNVRDQGLRQEDAKNLKPKPGQAVSGGARRRGARGSLHCTPAPGPLCTLRTQHTEQLGLWQNKTHPPGKSESWGLFC